MQTIEIKDFVNDVKDIEAVSQWHSCCTGKSTDSRLLRFVSQYSIMFMVIIFCLYELNQSKTCEDTTTYISLLTLILGVILPSPQSK